MRSSSRGWAAGCSRSGDPSVVDVLPLVGEADPGAAARPRATRPRRRGDRDRLRVASRPPRAARCRPELLAPLRPTSRSSRRGRSRRRSSTTARESTPDSWRCAAREDGRATGTGCPEHPCQREMLAEVAAAAEMDPRAIPTAVDGCGVVTFALPLERMAHASRGCPSSTGGARVLAAMRAHPDLIRGPDAADSISDACAARLGGEGRRGGSDVRGWPGRPRGRSQGRGREHAGCRCRARGGASPARLRAADCRARRHRLSRTAAASGSARSGSAGEARASRQRSRASARGNACNQAERSPFRTCSQTADRVIRFGADGSGPVPKSSGSLLVKVGLRPPARESRGPCSPSRSLSQTSRNSTSSSSKGRRRGSSPTTRSCPRSRTSS